MEKIKIFCNFFEKAKYTLYIKIIQVLCRLCKFYILILFVIFCTKTDIS